jgi:hypothetical protein
MKPIETLVCDVKCGIFDTEYTAKIYKDRIVVKTPFIKWTNNSGNLSFSKDTIMNQEIVDKVKAFTDDLEEDKAWSLIGDNLSDEYLICRDL